MTDLRTRSRAGLLIGTLLALLLLAPLLGPGYVLVRDMVFVPQTPLGTQLLGLDGVPRGVPSELVVALAGRVVPTGWLQDLILLALVVGGAWGAARLAPTGSRTAACAAATAYGWSPYLHERLLLGQWALLVGWAVLPWAVRAALEWRRGASAWPAVGALAIAALGGANALLLVGLAVAVCGRTLKAVGATLVFSLPWLVPGLLQHVVAGDPAGVAAFASRTDSPLGILGSLLTGGGVWAHEAVPAGRGTGALLGLLLLAVAARGVRPLCQRLGGRLVVAAGAGLLLALLGRLPLLADALRWGVVHVPATGLLRDGQKWIAPLVLLVSAAAACGVEVLLGMVAEVGVRRLAGVLLTLIPLAALPAGGWAEGGRLSASRYPPEWEQVTGRAHGVVLVLPWTLYRAFPWEDQQTILDPATKLLQRPVLDDALPLPNGSVAGEDPLAARLDRDATSGRPLLDALRAAGVTQVLVERTTSGYDAAVAARQVAGLSQVATSQELTLYDVPGPAIAAPAGTVLWPVLLGDGLAVLLGLTAAGSLLMTRTSGRICD